MKYNLFDIIAIVRSWFYKPEKDERAEILKLCMRGLDRLRYDEHIDRLIKGRRIPTDFSGELEWKYRAAQSFLRTYAIYVMRMNASEEKVKKLEEETIEHANVIKKIVSFSPNIIEMACTPEHEEWCEKNIPGKWKHISKSKIFVFKDENATALFKLYWG